MGLFTGPPPSVAREKVASRLLSPNSANWMKEITDELYSSYPFLVDYVFQPEIRKQDEATGTAIGGLVLQDGPGVKQAQRLRIVVPIIVKKGELASLDVLLVGENAPIPLMKETFGRAVLSPEVGMSPSRGGSSDEGILSQLWPPPVQRYGGLGGGPPYMKTSSVRTKFGHYTKVGPKRRVTWGDTIRIELPEPTKTAALVKSHHVLGISRLAHGLYEITAAPVTPEGLDPSSWTRSRTTRPDIRAKLASRLELLHELDRTGYVTVTSVRSKGVILGLVKEGMETRMISYSSRGWPPAGLVVVRTKSGEALIGQLYRMDNKAWGPNDNGVEPLGRSKILFTNGSVWALQDNVAVMSLNSSDMRSGAVCSDGETTSLHLLTPSGFGVFTGSSNEALGPVTILGKTTHPLFGQGWVGEYPGGTRRVFFEDSRIRVHVEDEKTSTVYLPKNYGWVSCGSKEVQLEDDPRTFVKTAHRETVKVAKVDHGTFVVWVKGKPTGGVMDAPSTEVFLGILGYAPETVKAALDRTELEIPVELTDPVYPKAPEVPKVDDLLKRRFDLLRGLIGRAKTAAEATGDEDTVESLLKLEVITPGALDSYVQAAPELEKLSSRLAEMLLAVRIGMSDISEGALKRAMFSVQSVSEGLRSLGLEAARRRA